MRYAGLPNLQLIGISVTEEGIQADSPAMDNLAEFLYQYFRTHSAPGKLSVINTDNVVDNGPAIQQFVTDIARKRWDGEGKFINWLNSNVTFHNTMVDRIVNSPPKDNLSAAPEAEPAPSIAVAPTLPRFAAISGHMRPLSRHWYGHRRSAT